MYHGQLLFRDHGQTPLPQHCQPWSNMVGNEKQWYHGHPDAGVLLKQRNYTRSLKAKIE